MQITKKGVFKIATGVLAVAVLALGLFTFSIQPARAATGEYEGCRLVIFAMDGLRDIHAQQLVQEGAPFLSSLNDVNPIKTAMSAGKSDTLAGWTAIWSGMPAYFTRAWGNLEYLEMPIGMHLVKQLWSGYYEAEKDFYVGWDTGKGRNIPSEERGVFLGTPWETRAKGPHWEVKRMITVAPFNEWNSGKFYGDEDRTNEEVFTLGQEVITEALTHENFILFIHFPDPDHTGHTSNDNFDAYMQSARVVDNYCFRLKQMLDGKNVKIIGLSDHGYGFKSIGDLKNGHVFRPEGFLTANFPLVDAPIVNQYDIGRMIFQLGDGNPDNLTYKNEAGILVRYQIIGQDLIAP